MFRLSNLVKAPALAAAFLCAFVSADDLKIAIQEPRAGEGLKEEARLVKDQFNTIITSTRGFQVFDRVNTSQIMDEHAFVRSSGLSPEAEARGLGEFKGADYVITSELTMLTDGDIRIVSQALDIVSARVVGSGNKLVSSPSSKAIMEASQDLMETLLKQVNKSTSGTGPGGKQVSQLDGLETELQRLLLNNKSNPKWNTNKGGYSLEVDLSALSLVENREFGTTRVSGRIYFTLTAGNGDSAGTDLQLEDFTEMTKTLIQKKVSEQVNKKAGIIIRDLLKELDQ